MLGLVLTAGGARGAYQAGVLKRIGELPSLAGSASPFPIVTGASAGAINGTMIAARAGDFREATQELARLWARLEPEHVFHTDAFSLSMGALRFVRDMALGSVLGSTLSQALLDATPLRAFLARALPLDGIADSIRNGHLYAVAILATSYHSGRSFTFVQGRPGHPIWVKSRRVVLPVRLTVKVKGVVPLLPSALTEAAAEIDTVCVTPSSSRMVPMAEPVPIVRPAVGFCSVTVNCSLASTSVSPATRTVTNFDVSPAANDSVPPFSAPAAKSERLAPLAPEPTIDQETLCGPEVSPDRVTVKVNGVVPLLPSALSADVAAIETCAVPAARMVLEITSV